MAFYIVAGIAVLALCLFAGSQFVRANPAQLASTIRIIGAILAALLAVAFMVGRMWQFAIPMGGLALWLYNQNRIKNRFSARHAASGASAGGGAAYVSKVRSQFLEMMLNQSSGDISGTVLSGTCQGQDLDDLTLQDLLTLAEEIGGDAESASLLEVYLDRRFPRWREDVQRDGGPRGGSSAQSGAMSEQEAYDILGLAPGASAAEIRSAHRSLIKRVHPDQGGSAFLAAKINQAKDRLLHLK